MTAPTASAPLDEPRTVDLRSIEHELSELWKQAHAVHSDSVTRVCVLNLVVGLTDDTIFNQVTNVVSQLTARHPNRAIVANIAPDAGESAIDAWVQAHCQLQGTGGQQVCCEQITVNARGGATAQVPGVVLPLLVPDVPVMLWWPRGAPFNAPFFERLCSFADRVIIDSATFDATQYTDALVTLLDHGHAVSDLIWGRLTSWRELTAQFFDAPATQPHLAQITQVEIDYTDREGAASSRIPALLLIGWLASRLGWTLRGPARAQDATTTFALQHSDGPAIEVVLRAVAARDESDHHLSALTLTSAGGRFSITRGENDDWANAVSEIDGRAPLRRGVRLEQPDEAELLGEELRLLNHDQGYEAALRFTAALLANDAEGQQ